MWRLRYHHGDVMLFCYFALGAWGYFLIGVGQKTADWPASHWAWCGVWMLIAGRSWYIDDVTRDMKARLSTSAALVAVAALYLLAVQLG